MRDKHGPRGRIERLTIMSCLRQSRRSSGADASEVENAWSDWCMKPRDSAPVDSRQRTGRAALPCWGHRSREVGFSIRRLQESDRQEPRVWNGPASLWGTAAGEASLRLCDAPSCRNACVWATGPHIGAKERNKPEQRGMQAGGE